MIYKHKKPKYRARSISSLNLSQGTNMNEVELTLLALAHVINKKIESGKKGVKVNEDNKISYRRLEKMLYALYEFFAYKGCMSIGICSTCSNFKNSGSESGVFGYCKNSQDKFKHAFDTCEDYKGDGGFGIK